MSIAREKSVKSNMGLKFFARTNSTTSQTPDDIATKKQLIAQFRRIIEENPDSPEAIDALQHLYSFVRTDWQNRLAERSNIYGYLKGLSAAHRNLEIGEIAQQLMIVNKMSEEKYDDAIALAESTPSTFSSKAKRDNMVHLISLYLRTGQIQEARNVFNTFKSAFASDEIYLELLNDMFKHIGSDISLAKTSPTPSIPNTEPQALKVASTLPTQFALDQNFPNPFNPATTIRYHLPKDAFITLTIYNLVGQKIQTLYEGQQNAGTHSAQWLGTNDFGAQVASGIYLVRMEAAGAEQKFIQSQKMASVK